MKWQDLDCASVRKAREPPVLPAAESVILTINKVRRIRGKTIHEDFYGEVGAAGGLVAGDLLPAADGGYFHGIDSSVNRASVGRSDSLSIRCQ